MNDRPKVAVVGGSLAGCATAVELVRAGYVVEVFERSAGELDGRGAGIITPRTVFEQMAARGLVPPDFPCREVRTVRYVARGGWALHSNNLFY